MLPLLQAGAEREEEEDEPRDTHFEEHLEVEDTEETRIELRAEEEVDNNVVGYADCGTANAS